MKNIFILFVFCFINFCNADEKKIVLNDSTSIYLKESLIDNETYFEHPEKITNISGFCFIDNELIFGTDFVLPKSKLDYAYVLINKNKISLNVSSIYNPFLSKCSFRTSMENGVLLINAKFSDGAGTYAVQWIIFKNKSVRTLISKDEYIFSKLFPIEK